MKKILITDEVTRILKEDNRDAEDRKILKDILKGILTPESKIIKDYCYGYMFGGPCSYCEKYSDVYVEITLPDDYGMVGSHLICKNCIKKMMNLIYEKEAK